ncbi:hypothetical protein KO498_07995 [Lentibacter algarum]|uniref:hypothetical protein n=1 Tax=Lentibacter algarum TaxID=576131 RepID=UPI001C07B2A4|nr:hypothetical protein [Lentibacter algarum]MBU2981755.1 hypothetical protein [Lentibacter algarum]
MNDYLSPEIEAALKAARKQAMRNSSRLRVLVDDNSYAINRMWNEGFALDLEDAPHLRGLVDVYDGAKHLMQCLIIASDAQAGEMLYEFKRATAAVDSAPLDYVRAADAPVALLGS